MTIKIKHPRVKTKCMIDGSIYNIFLARATPLRCVRVFVRKKETESRKQQVKNFAMSICQIRLRSTGMQLLNGR